MSKEKWYLDISKFSMIPGIAALIQSKSCSIFSFRLCVLMCAVAGFVWQTKVMVEEYLRYPTVLHIEERYVTFTQFPGVTFCYLNGLQNSFCRVSGCKRLTVKEFRELYPREKVPINHSDGFLVPVNINEIYLLPPKKLRQLETFSTPPTVMPFLKFFQMHVGIISFNILERNVSMPLSFTDMDFITGTELHLRNIQQSDTGHRFNVELKGGQISVHSRHNFNNPFLTGVSVERGKNMVLRFRQECIEHCKLNLSLLDHDCVLESIWYPHNYQRCMPKNQLQLLGEYHQKCAPQCNEACSEMIYEVQKEEEYIPAEFTTILDWNDPFVSEVALKRNRRTDISIVFENEKCFLYEKQPKYNIIEVMSNIGGFLGMWMGVSMIAVLNLFENLLTIIFYAMKKRKSKKKSAFINIA
ncbi:amiloride-sensitive cation channel 5 [Trichonephila inaurata madagascariensis]|uniref:Amiloride-sensitive cation channel 5 n=1 Tax=Trichonephila inaurata madagascariensis TaxID=2747483 RepID=A0A8X7CUY3_9ARAC|nr:amiloride-sensitive cation channel 5 [Trichonephila inaurata madagascariensis]